MIAFLKGLVHTIELQSAIVLSGGVGYRVFVPGTLLSKFKTGQPAELFIHHHTSDNGEALYGFASSEELQFFEDLLSVSGVGPKSGLAILSQTSMDAVKRAIIHGDTEPLRKVSGIGKKIAERIVVELKNKIAVGKEGGVATAGAVAMDDALDGLVALGFSKSEALDALTGIDPNLPAKDRIKMALSKTGKRQ